MSRRAQGRAIARPPVALEDTAQSPGRARRDVGHLVRSEGARVAPDPAPREGPIRVGERVVGENLFFATLTRALLGKTGVYERETHVHSASARFSSPRTGAHLVLTRTHLVDARAFFPDARAHLRKTRAYEWDASTSSPHTCTSSVDACTHVARRCTSSLHGRASSVHARAYSLRAHASSSRAHAYEADAHASSEPSCADATNACFIAPEALVSRVDQRAGAAPLHRASLHPTIAGPRTRDRRQEATAHRAEPTGAPRECSVSARR
jgi:hypothetical protein